MDLDGSLEPRQYQQRIAEVAASSNTLVVLPTGLGKTLVAVLVAKARLERFPKGKVVVLAPTKPLALQHFDSFKRTLQTSENEACLQTGEIHPEERSYLWRRSRFIFATPQTVRNDVRDGRVELNEVVLMVFDEAHRSVKDYSYTQLAKAYKEQGWNPLILGLTASPGGSKERVNEIMRNLFIEKVEARNEEDEDVRSYVEQTRFEGIKISLPQEYDSILNPLREIYNEKVTRLMQAGFLPKTRLSKKILLQSRASMLARLNGSGRGGLGRGYIFGSLIHQAQAVIILHAIELIETQGVEVLRKYLSRLRERPEQGKSASALLKDPRWLIIEQETTRLQGSRNPKLEKLSEITRTQLNGKPDSRIIVFTQYRDTIQTIVERLGSDGLKCMRFVGQADKVDSEGMDQDTQTRVLDMFRAGEFSVLVSSSIGEEGLHVPDVDLVVFFEAVPSEIRSIQRKGRTGRTRPGRVVVLLAEGTVDEAYYYSSLSRERVMKSLVSSSSGAPREERKPVKKTKPVTLLDYL